MLPRGTVGGALKDMVKPELGHIVVVVSEVGRPSFRGVLGREDDEIAVLAMELEGNGRLLGRLERWRVCDEGPKRGSMGLEKSTLLRQRMVMTGLQVGEI